MVENQVNLAPLTLEAFLTEAARAGEVERQIRLKGTAHVIAYFLAGGSVADAWDECAKGLHAAGYTDRRRVSDLKKDCTRAARYFAKLEPIVEAFTSDSANLADATAELLYRFRCLTSQTQLKDATRYTVSKLQAKLGTKKPPAQNVPSGDDSDDSISGEDRACVDDELIPSDNEGASTASDPVEDVDFVTMLATLDGDTLKLMRTQITAEIAKRKAEGIDAGQSRKVA